MELLNKQKKRSAPARRVPFPEGGARGGGWLPLSQRRSSGRSSGPVTPAFIFTVQPRQRRSACSFTDLNVISLAVLISSDNFKLQTSGGVVYVAGTGESANRGTERA